MAFSFVACRVALIAALLLGALAGSAGAAEDRALKLFFTHTGERATIVFKRGGRYDPRGLAQINRFLRDWRKNEPTKIDPELLDLVWEVYSRSGAREPIHVVSAYRSPSTNTMLRTRSAKSGVAKHSQHTLGKAMDFYIPGVKLASLRAIAMQMQIGGVGFYPNSGSPFVHLDVGRVRAWPRMSRQELARLFPSGRTLHMPADGRPLPGYEVAVAQSKKRPGKFVSVADDEDDDAKPAAVASAPAVAPDTSLLTSMLPTPRSRAANGLELQLGKRVAEENKAQPFPDLASYAVPLPISKPISISVIPMTAPERPAPLLLASLVIGRNDLGKLLVTDHSKRSTDDAIAKLQPMADLPASAVQDVSGGVSAMSTGDLVAWALQPAGLAMEMTMPGLVDAPIPLHQDAADFAGNAPGLEDDDFDVERFGFEG
ncbi:DUF882 domain-containing protein [Rhizobium sp. P38BS-XIX]|uniref:DUF882 domain-containing protein n=1 Tax=Rhizobium sp. P38BS-XIX TaxID=2726740 RepID=UPI0014570681|nr:DUF882 domain-containing protein [Rhizobium sp. P38BS-XIX]NLR98209.1 DUF882 domain-containing protein [Rhizobium sp. P38BS-XIX]